MCKGFVRRLGDRSEYHGEVSYRTYLLGKLLRFLGRWKLLFGIILAEVVVAGVIVIVVFFFSPFFKNVPPGLARPIPEPTRVTGRRETPEPSTQVPGPTETEQLSATPVPPTATSVPQTTTSVPPTATPVPPTATPVPPTATSVPPTATSVPPTATFVSPTATATPPTPSLTPSATVDICTSLTVIYITSSSYSSFEVANAGSQTVTITKVLASWAIGNLEQFLFGGTVIKTFSPPATAVVNIDQFDGPITARELDQGQSKIFYLNIDGTIMATTLTLHFDGVCVITTMT